MCRHMAHRKPTTGGVLTELLVLSNLPLRPAATHSAPPAAYDENSSTPKAISRSQLLSVRRAAAKRSITSLDLAQLSLRALDAGESPQDPSALLAAVIKALKLPDTASPGDAFAAVQRLVDLLASRRPGDGHTRAGRARAMSGTKYRRPFKG